MTEFFETIETHFLIGGLLTSLLLIGGLAVLRMILVKIVRGKAELLSNDKRRLIITIKNVIWIVLVIGLILIWAPEIQMLALSLTAFAVAFVIGVKEWIMQIMGGLYRASTKPFKAGDWITVAGLSGEVMDMDAFSVRLQEIDIAGQSYQFTGHTLLVPNSHFLTNHVDNHNFIKSHVFIDAHVILAGGVHNPQEIKNRLLDIAGAHYESGRADAEKLVARVERKASVDIPDPAPQVFLSMDGVNEKYTLRMMVPTKEAARIRSAISTELLSWAYKRKESGKRAKKKKGAE